MIARQVCEAAFGEAVRACDPALRVRLALGRTPVRGSVLGLAVGKAAYAMACGAGPVSRGLIIAPVRAPGGVPPGWRELHASHPTPDATSVAAGIAALALVESAGEGDTVLALISGGASSLLEVPREGLTLAELVAQTREAMHRGAPIRELNELRTSLSALKGGKLADRSLAPVTTLVVSDVIGDDPRVVGSGPTIRDVFGDRVEVVAPMALFGEQVERALAARGLDARRREAPIADDVATVAAALAEDARDIADGAVLVAWGEPTVRVPEEHGTGGRAQQLALELAGRLRGTSRSALVAGSDGIDGATSAAGAFVDGGTWDAIARAGIAPADSLARCDAGTALAAVGATFVTGPTGINHADVVVIG